SGNKVTIAFWANTDISGQGTAPFAFLKAGPGRVFQSHLLWTNANVYWDMGYVGAAGDAYYRTNAATTSTPGTWTHWTFVYDGALTTQTQKVYRDGTLIASGNQATPQPVNWAGIDVAELGNSQLYGTRWAGSMDDFAVWDEALTPAQITTIRTSGVQALVPAQIKSFTATPGNIAPGGTAVLSWNTQAATSLSINNGVGTVTGATGAVNVNPASTTTYRLTATNSGGSSFRDVLVAVGAVEQPLVLNEFLADNGSGLLDEDGSKQDWIEIYNPNSFAASANGWKLVNGITEWVFPNVQIEGGAYLVVFASAKNRVVPGANLHTNFKLDPAGEYLALKKPDGSIATEFAPAYPAQRTDVSGGLAAGTPAFFLTPTPGATNGASVTGFVKDTVFSVNRGFYTATQNVAITCATAGAQIRYTTDNSTPTTTTGTVYSAPVAVSATTVLRARAFLAGFAPSNTDTQTYLFVADVPNQGPAPAGWPATGVNGQALRYGFSPTLKAQYTAQQLTNALNQIPSFSIVTDQPNLTDATTGIYVNALLKGDAWERESSVELLNPDGSDGFHINCGLRIRGGYSRNDQFAKHSFRFFFRSQYGKGKLKHPLFGNTGADEFQTIDLRSEQNYSWANDGGTENTAVREAFCRDVFGTMGQATTRSRYYHVYLNGQYWGLFMTEERAQEDYGATYFGGASDDYDVVQTSNHTLFTYELASGSIDAWQQTWNLARACAANPTNANYFALLGRDASGVRVPAMPVYIDPEHLAAYMVLHYYTGDGDGPLSNFLGMNRANNWRGFRNRLTDAGWRFFPHDCEHTLLAPSWVNARATNNTTTGTNRTSFTYSNSEWIHEDLATNAEFKLKIADVAQRHLLNGGALASAKAQAIFDARAALIGQAIVADCTRWGTSATNHTLAQWNARLANIRTNFFPTRAATVIAALRTRGFYPAVDPPTFSQRGGQVAPGFALTLSQSAQTGAIYYTLDGTDPRAIGGAAVGTLYSAPIVVNSPMRARARFRSSAAVWSALDEVTFTIYPPATSANLVVSKLHYHPPGPTPAENTADFTTDDHFEFIELLNIGATMLDLTNVTLSDAVTFAFSGSSITALAPGARVLVAANAGAFAMRYGSGLPVAGVFAGSFHNSGDFVRVLGAVGT
ncbi:MAG: chitobiase/beta-hexosaminidase C-terminal domain-containing protein, partial [Chthoniobacteraceae bacterium]